MKHNKVAIPAKVMEGLEKVRLSGKTNMLDIPMVESLALDMGYSITVLWIRENKNLYIQGVFSGFDQIDSNADLKEGDGECADK